jgi:hypothetical protein
MSLRPFINWQNHQIVKRSDRRKKYLRGNIEKQVTGMTATMAGM